VPTPSGPVVDESGVTFRLPDAAHRLRGVRLAQEVGLTEVDFAWHGGAWQLNVSAPDVDRMEYLFDINLHGRRQTVLDPTNPRTVDGAFGQKSDLWLPGYAEPGWLHEPAVAATCTDFEIAGVDGLLWQPEQLGEGEAAPLLVVHDGPEYAELGALTQYLGAFVADATLPPLRAALLAPGDRNARYSADEAYAKTLAVDVVAQLRENATVVVGVGASLGALAMLHAHYRHPDTFDGLLLQSGSFFTPELDPQEREFSGFRAVTRFVGGLTATRAVPTVITCGTVEENLANNRQMAQLLAGLGFPVRLEIVRDAHNYTAWRDALHPNLTELVQQLVGAHAP
jgi:enterochelin esterase family protein